MKRSDFNTTTRVAVAALAALSACAPTPSYSPGAARVANLGPGAVELGALAGGDSRALLPNLTEVPGDNVFVTFQPGLARAFESSTELALRALNEPSGPFAFVIDRDFVAVPSPAGPVRAVVRRPAPDTTCVLAVQSGGGTISVMRNCAPGDIGAAMAPLGRFGGPSF